MPEPTEIEFEAALAELEQIVEALERGGPDLKRALAGYGRGISLLGHCQGVLDNAERSVALLVGVDDNGQPIRSPFDSSATAPLPSTSAPVAKIAETVGPNPIKTQGGPSPGPSRNSKPTPAPSVLPEAPF